MRQEVRHVHLPCSPLLLSYYTSGHLRAHGFASQRHFTGTRFLRVSSSTRSVPQRTDHCVVPRCADVSQHTTHAERASR